MREIKFRAFIDGEMVYDLAYEEYAPINDLLKGTDNLMQYTGLPDKQGVEIYEGDIVKYITRAVSHLDGIVWTGRVMYQYGAFRLCRFINNDMHSEGIGYGLPYEYEIIGNIYENPELLEVK